MTLRAPDWPKCTRCFKPAHPDRRVVHEGNVYCCGDCIEARDDDVSQSTLRRQVLDRDGGRCASCGLDCLELRRVLDALRAEALAGPAGRPWPARDVYEARLLPLIRDGFPRSLLESGKALWAADHIDERVRNGATSLSNAQTLCVACHAVKTSALASDRASLRRPMRRGR